MKPFFQKFFPTKKRIQVAFCQKNLNRHLNDKSMLAFSEFLQHSHIQYKEYECMSKCDLCLKSAFSIVNGKYIEFDNMHDLLQYLKSNTKEP